MSRRAPRVSAALKFLVILTAALSGILFGCAALTELDQASYDASSQLAPSHPVYGTPIFNLVSEEREIAQASQAWAQIEAAAQEQGIAIDPEGERLDGIRSAFQRLVAVAHRRDLPWKVHLLDAEDVNAFTFGGGLVVVLDGLFGGLVDPSRPDELAAVLAHEVAHVTLLHLPTRTTWTSFSNLAVKKATGEYYRAAYTTEQEAEADRIAALYLALAGFDPMAAVQIWDRAHQRSGSSGAASAFLHDHPLDADRMAATREAAAQVAQYFTPGAKNPQWEALLVSNALYERAEEKPYAPGAGLGRAGAAAVDTWLRHERALQEEENRENIAAAFQAIQIVRAWEQPTSDGYQGVFLEVHNGTDTPVLELAVNIHYLGGQQLLATDDTCRVAVAIPAGQTIQVGCYKRQVPGTTGLQPQIADVRWEGQ